MFVIDKSRMNAHLILSRICGVQKACQNILRNKQFFLTLKENIYREG